MTDEALERDSQALQAAIARLDEPARAIVERFLEPTHEADVATVDGWRSLWRRDLLDELDRQLRRVCVLMLLASDRFIDEPAGEILSAAIAPLVMTRGSVIFAKNVVRDEVNGDDDVD